MLRGYQSVQSNLADAAEKMPEEHYGFKPTPEVKPFGQLVAHIALSQFGLCSRSRASPIRGRTRRKRRRAPKPRRWRCSRPRPAYCEPLVTGLTETTATELVTMGQDKVAKGLIPVSLVTHGMEMYGTMAVYLRLKGIVPPTTEKQNQMKKSEREVREPAGGSPAHQGTVHGCPSASGAGARVLVHPLHLQSRTQHRCSRAPWVVTVRGGVFSEGWLQVSVGRE